MILFIAIEICILAYTIFADDWLIYHIRRSMTFTTRKARIKSIMDNISCWFWANVFGVMVNMLIVLFISFVTMAVFICTQPRLETQWSFNINALKDNLVTEGYMHSSMFSARGYVDGEISYFYSRTMSQGEKIERIPADKTYIRYDDTVHPRVEVHQSQLDIPEWAYKVFWLEMMNEKVTDYYVIVAPNGTIANTGTYQIDME